ncbi:thiopeptide-type bacteriocin biosynthesis protein [Pedobacter fastidiosus]|uniref:Lantibiotic dehydratase n=1 Tax=Pedobacter fastidiosus TaxID=2765361 RepID=A0ABR7KLX9_9SPHI|nr:lantibiotic dehydratase [Pedobacter fastidiosus]MBC6109082.1 lantibiotic dehydratase [Pedobacter fastidiosus]
MKINIHPTAIFRTPKFSYQSDISACWDELKEAIAISSEAFYETIKDVKADEIQHLPPKIFFTIWKYFNRAKFRSTPYGTFASFSVLKDSIKFNADKIIIEEHQQEHSFIDWPQKNNIAFSIAELLAKNCLLFSNSSYYPTSNSLRYIACTDGLFELAEIDQDIFVQKILDACLKPISVENLIKTVGIADDEHESFFILIGDMHDLQLLFTDRDPNILGEDYFKRIGILDTDLPRYIIAERKAKAGQIEERLLQNVPNLVNLLQQIIPYNEKEAIKKFTTRFKKKFEQKEVSLLMALDPEMGVGYDELEQAGQSDDFVAQFSNIKKDQTKDKEAVKSVLGGALNQESFKKDKPIYLNKLTFNLNEKPTQLPNTFSMLMSVSDDLVCVDQVGGITANGLSGRFTMANSEVEHQSKLIAQIEQQANPDILFFDVAYMVEATIDNINRRKIIYGHQLSILNYDTSEEPLLLNDIMISVRGSEIVLRSKKLNKRMVPKMASAYNYTRSDLSIFRLLCDLQHQNIATNLTLSLESLFPDLDYYPRLQFHNLLLSRAKWQVKRESIFPSKNEQLNVNQCRSFLTELGVSKCFKTGASDQTLCFDLENDDDLNSFIQYMQKQKTVYLEEVLLPESSMVVDENGKPYLAQFILNLYQEAQIYAPSTLVESTDSIEVTQYFPPGSEWLYFEIYCHQQRSDEMLTGVINYFLDTHQEDVKSWFFIRYNENGNHLRLRVLLNDVANGQKLTGALSNYLAEDLKVGLVSDLQIKTYKRETQRYGNALIATVENHFGVDSDYVLSLLQTQSDTFLKYKLCSDVADKILESGMFDKKDFAKIIKMFSDSFNEEHKLDAADFKKLNAQYQLYRKADLPELDAHQIDKFDLFTQSFSNILKQASPDKKVSLFSDLMHMHVNRLFNKDQRTHEMLMYYYLLKDVQRRNAMAN